MAVDFPIAVKQLHTIIERFAGKRVLVIGDMVADEYMIGRPTRIAREAPVLILELNEERTVPGGATNVAVNARTLGAEVFLAGVVGDDLPGQRLRKAVGDLQMHQEGLVTDTQRPTSTKTRIMAGSPQIVQQHIVRIDRVDTSDLAEASKGYILDYINNTLAELNEAGERLLHGSHAQSILITRGAEGMSLFEEGKTPVHLPVHRLDHASEIVDTNGAGDTVAATFTLALTTGANFAEAAYLANAAAALVVRRLGCASNTPQELMSALHE